MIRDTVILKDIAKIPKLGDNIVGEVVCRCGHIGSLSILSSAVQPRPDWQHRKCPTRQNWETTVERILWLRTHARNVMAVQHYRIASPNEASYFSTDFPQ